MKWLNFAIAAICFAFAALQYNDPDPLIWVGMYGAVGVFAILSALGWRLRLGAIALVGLCLFMMGRSAPGVYSYLTNKDGQTVSNAMSKEFPYIEETREFGGATLGLVFVACSFFSARCCRAGKDQSIQGS